MQTIISEKGGQTCRFAATPAAQNVLVQSFQTNLRAIGDISDSDKTALTQRAEAIVRDEVYPAYQRQIEALQAIQPRAGRRAKNC